MEIKLKKTHATFKGETQFFEHTSVVTGTKMNFSVFIPSKGVTNAIIWLSGLTCTDENFMTKAGAQVHLSDTNTMIICPDTSPRGLDLPGEHDGYDFGSGAGFYLTATTDGYKDHYKMDKYIIEEIVPLLKETFGVKKIAISGHSMGGHGALTLGLNHKDLFTSVSAFSPIVNPVNCPWGKKAFTGYLGEITDSWKQYDTCEILKSGVKRDDTLLISQGKADEFLEKELLTENLQMIANECGQNVDIHYHDGFDHSYYFIQSFIEDHINFHLKNME